MIDSQAEKRAENAPDSKTKVAPDSTGNDGTKFVLFFYGTIGLFIVWNSDTAQQFLYQNYIPIGIVLAAALGLFFFQRDALKDPRNRQITLVIFVAIPILALLGLAVWLSTPPYQVVLLRSVFLLIVCLLPATMYYLFIASRKSSLLHEYFTNLSRLGLLGSIRQETELETGLRVMSYIQKFEAVYGAVPRNLAKRYQDTPDTRKTKLSISDFQDDSTGGAIGGVFTHETAIPVVLATLLIGLGWLLTLPPWEIISFPPESTIFQRLWIVLEPKEITVHFAFLGAYFFSLQMLFRRYVRKDLRVSAYIAVSLRIILAVIGAWVVLHAVSVLNLADTSNARDNQAMLVIGFVIGAFPPIAWQVIQAAFQKVTGAKYLVPSLSSAMPVSDLDGLTVWHQSRLEEEDIESIPNMATADLVELMLNTRIPPNRIIDWVDQAILYTQLGQEQESGKNESKQSTAATRRERLREHGIRTASALIAAYEMSKQFKDGDIDLFEKILPGEGRSRIRSLVDTLSTNPNLELVQTWRQLTLSAPSVARAG